MVINISVTKSMASCKISYMKTTGERIKFSRMAKNISQDKLAKFIGVSRPAITQWENNENTPKGAHLLKCAELLEVEPNWLISGERKEYRRIKTKIIPIIDWDQLIRFGPTFYEHINMDDNNMIIVPNIVGEKSFAVTIVSDSMESSGGGQSFPINEVIVIDPNKKHKSGSYVVALNKTGKECLFRQYIIDGGIAYLKPINPQYATVKAANYTIIGTCCYRMAFVD